MNTPDLLLELVGVSMSYGRGETSVIALNNIDLQVSRGELVAVMGASGSGKSTLLTIAGGLMPPSDGSVFVSGQPLERMTAKQLAILRRRSLGYVFQDFNLVPSLTALENVSLPLELDGWRSGKARRPALEALRVMEMSDRANRYPAELSGGQQQRVAIARAVVGGRSLVLADEPTGALDSSTGELVLKMLRGRIDAGAGGILVTHDARHAAWADRVVFLRDGSVVDEVSSERPESLFRGSES